VGEASVPRPLFSYDSEDQTGGEHMALSHEFSITGHPSIYDGSERELKIWFSEPHNGVNDRTGLLLLSSDFGEEPSSEYYQQIRERFSDAYNMVVIQCDYFGSRFMGAKMNPKFIINTDALRKVLTQEEWERVDETTHLNMDELMEVGAKYDIHLEGQHQMDESLKEFNDMGIMQALDNLTAVNAVIAILEDNGYNYDYSRVLAYGRGHGAYIHYLCNALDSQLFSGLIDYNAWLYPDYLRAERVLRMRRGQMHITILFDYLARRQPSDYDLLYLPSLYRKFENRCQLICLEEASELTRKGQSEKQRFCKSIDFAMHIEIGGIKEASQRIDSEYEKLFDYVMNNMQLGEKREGPIKSINSQINTSKYRYEVLFSQGMPTLQRYTK
jgi:hypothetical protein